MVLCSASVANFWYLIPSWSRIRVHEALEVVLRVLRLDHQLVGVRYVGLLLLRVHHLLLGHARALAVHLERDPPHLLLLLGGLRRRLRRRLLLGRLRRRRLRGGHLRVRGGALHRRVGGLRVGRGRRGHLHDLRLLVHQLLLDG